MSKTSVVILIWVICAMITFILWAIGWPSVPLGLLVVCTLALVLALSMLAVHSSPGAILGGPFLYALGILVVRFIRGLIRLWKRAHGIMPVWWYCALACLPVLGAVLAFWPNVIALTFTVPVSLYILSMAYPRKAEQKKFPRIEAYSIEDLLTAYPGLNSKNHVGKVVLGKDNGEWRWHDLHKKWHILIAGATQYGKSHLIRSVLCQLYLRPSWWKEGQVAGIDLKKDRKDGLWLFRSVLWKYADEPEDAMTVLLDVEGEIDRRFKTGKEDEPLLLLVIDEVANLTEDPEYKASAVRVLSKIARTGAGANVRLVLITQHLTVSVIPRNISTNILVRAIFHPVDAAAVRQVIPEFPAEMVSSLNSLQPGQFYCQWPGDGDPHLVNGEMVERDMVARAVTACLEAQGENDLAFRALRLFIQSPGIGMGKASGLLKTNKGTVERIYHALVDIRVFNNTDERGHYSLALPADQAVVTLLQNLEKVRQIAKYVGQGAVKTA